MTNQPTADDPFAEDLDQEVRSTPIVLPCPFCGVIPKLIRTPYTYIQCQTPECVQPDSYNLDAWNTRKP